MDLKLAGAIESNGSRFEGFIRPLDDLVEEVKAAETHSAVTAAIKRFLEMAIDEPITKATPAWKILLQLGPLIDVAEVNQRVHGSGLLT